MYLKVSMSMSHDNATMVVELMVKITMLKSQDKMSDKLATTVSSHTVNRRMSRSSDQLSKMYIPCLVVSTEIHIAPGILSLCFVSLLLSISHL